MTAWIAFGVGLVFGVVAIVSLVVALIYDRGTPSEPRQRP